MEERYLIITIILLFIASSFFSGSETALTAANKIKIQTKASKGDKKSQQLLKTVSNTEEFISGILIANNIPNIILPSLVTVVALEYGFNVGIATAILTVLIIIFAEVLPKSVAAAFPDRTAYIVYTPTRIILFILKPITLMLNAFTRLVIKFLGRNQGQQKSFEKDEIRAMVDIGHTEGTFGNNEVFGLKGVLDFSKLNVSDILQTPRTEVQAISLDTKFEEAREILLNPQFSRYPVYDGDIDNIIGIFHTKFFVSWSVQPEKQIKEFSDLDPLYVHEANSVSWVFKQMLQEKKHLAIVRDEYGGTEGIITHEELIEALIGQDIRDETDIEDLPINKLTDTEIICEGKISLRRLNNVFHTAIPEQEDNLASFILSQLMYVPKIGETIEYGNLTFEILNADSKKIILVKISKNK